jgi:hypothetical protein
MIHKAHLELVKQKQKEMEKLDARRLLPKINKALLDAQMVYRSHTEQAYRTQETLLRSIRAAKGYLNAQARKGIIPGTIKIVRKRK